MNKELVKMVNVSEELGWSIEVQEKDIMLSKFSPAGQNFYIEIDKADDIHDIIHDIKERCDNFDCSEETFLWLDNTGHGINGAPYDMKDLYEDMEACLEMMEELHNELDTTFQDE